jgi:hypothetical protein
VDGQRKEPQDDSDRGQPLDSPQPVLAARVGPSDQRRLRHPATNEGSDCSCPLHRSSSRTNPAPTQGAGTRTTATTPVTSGPTGMSLLVERLRTQPLRRATVHAPRRSQPGGPAARRPDRHREPGRDEGWAAAQDHLTALSTNVLHRVVDATHTGLLEDQGPANESAGAVVEVVDAVGRVAPSPAAEPRHLGDSSSGGTSPTVHRPCGRHRDALLRRPRSGTMSGRPR